MLELLDLTSIQKESCVRCLAVHYSVLVCVTFEGLPTSVWLPVTPFPHNAPAARPR